MFTFPYSWFAESRLSVSSPLETVSWLQMRGLLSAASGKFKPRQEN
jgi:hypothetical protein